MFARGEVPAAKHRRSGLLRTTAAASIRIQGRIAALTTQLPLHPGVPQRHLYVGRISISIRIQDRQLKRNNVAPVSPRRSQTEIECGEQTINLNGKPINGGGKRAGQEDITDNVSGKRISIQVRNKCEIRISIRISSSYKQLSQS